MHGQWGPLGQCEAFKFQDIQVLLPPLSGLAIWGPRWPVGPRVAGKAGRGGVYTPQGPAHVCPLCVGAVGKPLHAPARGRQRMLQE